MKTKNNTFKRIAAGALATISVATNVMSANVGGTLFVDTMRAALVAQAADGTVDFGGINKYLTSFSNGKTTFDANALAGITSFAAKEGDTVTVKSSIPLNFVQKIDNVAVNADMFDADTTTKVDNTAYVPSTDAYDAANFTKVYSAKTGKEFQIAKIGNDGKETINVGDITTENDITGCSFYPANVDLVVKKNSAGNDVIAYADTNGTFIEADRLMAYEGTSTDTEIFYANVINVAKSTASGAAFEQNTYSLNTGYSAFEYEGGNTWNAVNGETTNFINSANDGVDSKYIFFQGNVQAENINEAGTQAYVVDKTITSDNFEEKKADLYLKKDNPDTLAVIWEPQASAVVFDTQADYYKLENAVNDAATACTLTKVKTTGTYKAYTIELDAAGNITSAIEENNLNLGNDDVIDITAENNKYSLLKAADANNIVLVPDGTSVLKDADDYLHFVKNAGATTPANWKKETILVTAQAGDEGTKYSTDKLKEGTGDTIADATASDLIEKTLTLTHDALDTYTFINVNDGVNALGVARTLAWGTEENNTNLPLYVKAGPENLTTGYKFIGAAADAAYYKVIDEQHDNENETTTLKNGRVYFTKSGNSYVYSYKINSNVKIIGQEAKVEVTNGLADANDIWGDNTTNARLTGPRTAVDDLTLTSDLNPNGVNVVNDANAKAAYKNENVVLSSSNYFKVRIWNGKQKTAYKEYATKFNSKTNKWESTFPVYVDAEGDITQVLVEKADPVYTYTTNGSVLSVSGSGIDSEAAYIKAYAVSKADAETNGQGKPVSDAEKKKYAITSDTTQSYGSSVYVDIERIAEFASAKNSVNEYSTLKITRNGNEITGEADNPETEANETVALGNTIHNDKYDADVPANDSINRAQNFTFNQPGEYEITYTVYINANKTTAVAKELKFKFTIDTQAKLTASNVKLTFSSKDAGIITGATEVTNENADQFPDEIEVGSYAKVVTGAENLKLPVDVEDLKNKSIDVTATLVDAQGRDLDDIKVILSGATTVNELNLSQPLYITYNNDQYSTGSETIVINWQAVSKAKQFNIFQPNGETPLYTELGNNYEVNVSVDEIADIQKIVESNYVLKNGDAKKISYEYSVGKGDKLESQELDWHEAGFPKEIGEYSLYILYANEPIAIVDLNVIKHSLHAAPTDAQLNITYGDKLFTEEELGYADAEGNAVKDADVKNPEIKFYETEPVEDAQVKQIVDGKLNGAPVYEKDGKYYTLGDDVEDPYDAPLNAGVYVAEIKAKGGNATTVGKADYTLMSDTFVLSVAKKQITADMITIAPKNYKNDYYTINAEDIEGKDTAITKNFANAATAVSLKIASGEQSGKNIGGYTVNVTVDDKAEVQNYTGTVKNFKWYIIKGAEKDGENYSGLFWNDTETTIVDNGNINVEFGKSANLVGEVVEFGFIGDKSGKIGAPAIANGESYMSNKTNGIYNYSENFDPDDGDAYEADDEAHMADPNVQAAYKELVYGAGINPAKQNAAMIAKKGADTFGVSVRIEDANTGVWVRPYLILKVDGEDKLYYGEVRYLNLVEEATAMLNLKASAMGAANNNDHVAQEAVTKDQAKAQYADNSDLAYMEDAKSGYWAEKNQFYAYAHYNFDKNSKVKDSAIQGFGVVLDKSGYIPAGTTLDDNDEAFKKAKEVLIPANKGKNGILSGISKDNPKMLKNEMGVAVNPKDAVTGVWLRSFVDFGNGLIVYTDPVYIKSVSEQYAACKPGVVGNKAANAAKINYTVTANVVDDNADAAAVIPKFKGANAVIKEAGVVVDKNGTLFKLNDEGKYTGFVDDIKTKFIADNATANGYNKGKKGIDINPATVGTTIFTGHAFQVTNKSGNYIKTVARPFVVYTINGKDITIYGDPVEDTTLNTTYPEPVID